MYLAPTFGEVAFWLICAVVAIVALLGVCCMSASSKNQVDDLAAWQRNYERTQLRNR